MQLFHTFGWTDKTEEHLGLVEQLAWLGNQLLPRSDSGSELRGPSEAGATDS